MFRLFHSVPRQRVSVFWLNCNKQKINQKSFIESIFWYFSRKFRVVSICFALFQFVLKQFVSVFRFHTETESFYVSIEPKHTEDQQKQFDREHILVFFWKFKVVWFASKQFCLFQLFGYRLETPKKPKFFAFGFTKQTETQLKQILFRFVLVRTEFFFVCFEPS